MPRAERITRSVRSNRSYGASMASSGVPGVPSWVPNPTNPPDIAVNWTLNQAWKKSGGLTTPAALGITTSRASVKQVVDSNGNWSQVAANTTAVSNLGRSTEEARTNSIPNNSMVGASAPSNVPTGWAGLVAANGLTPTVAAVGTQNGINYIDVQIQGTATATSSSRFVIFTANNAVAASSGQTWTESAFSALSGGTLNGITAIQYDLRGFQSDGTTNDETFQSSDFHATLTSTLTRGSFSATFANALTAFARAGLSVSYTSGQVINFTLRIGWPQLELGASVTSPIITSGSAATRNADVTTMSASFGSAFTMFTRGTSNDPIGYPTNPRYLSLNDGTSNNVAELIMDRTTGKVDMNLSVGGVNQYSTSLSATNYSGVQQYSAHALSAGAQAATVGGVTPTTKTAATIFTPTQINFGSQPGGAQLNGLATIDAIWLTQAVPNAQLQSMQ